ncbi:MAG: hypothetical protein WBG46_02710 [Nonlabens sp.]
MRIILYALVVISLIACRESETQSKSEKKIMDQAFQKAAPLASVEKMEQAHGKKIFSDREAVKFDLHLKFRGKDRLDATIYMLTDSQKVRVNNADGTSILFDGKDIWYNGESGKDASARFDVLTWSYFFALPFKVTDPGTNIKTMDSSPEFEKLKLTFQGNIGDTPQDWYHLFVDKQSHLLNASGYIVTYGDVDVEKAEKNAHAIVYKKYENVEGVHFAAAWSFHNYKDNNIEKNVTIGSAELKEIEFGTFNDQFDIPQGSHKIKVD